MDKDKTLSKKIIFILSASVLAAVLIIYIVFTPFFLDPSEPDEEDWENYPYVIPGTDMRFPDEEGLHPEGETWISVGLRLDFPDSDLKRTYIIMLYHEEHKSVYFSTPEETHHTRQPGEQTLPEGKLDMSFNNLDLPEDRFTADEDGAFNYDLRSFFEIEETKYAVDLELESKKPPATIQEFDGEMHLGEEYYRIHSLTNCAVSGTINIDEKRYGTEGVAWIENQRGLFDAMEWEWFAFWTDGDREMKIVDVYGSGENKKYGMYVDDGGEVLTVKDIYMEVTSTKQGFGYSWEVSSEEHPVRLNITCIEERMQYPGFAVGLGEVRGELMGEEIATKTYVELTKPRTAPDEG